MPVLRSNDPNFSVWPPENSSQLRSRKVKKIYAVSGKVRLIAVDQHEISSINVEQIRSCLDAEERLRSWLLEMEPGFEKIAAERSLPDNN